MRGIILGLLCYWTAVSLGANVSVDLTLSTSVAHPGDSLTAVCNVTNMNFVHYIVVWSRKLPEDGQEVELATNTYLNKPFLTSSRYTGDVDDSLHKSHNYILYKLNIKNLQVADSGDLSCKVPGENGQLRSLSTKSFIVEAPVDSVVWSSKNWNTSRVDVYGNGQNVTYREGDPLELTCVVNGSYPSPLVHVYLGNKDITKNFTRIETMEFGSGTKLFRDVYYNVKLTQNFSAKFEFDDKELKCIAKVSTTGNKTGVESRPEKSTRINTFLSEYKPKFLCNSVLIVELNKAYFPITCTVRAKPPVDDINFWPGALAGDNKTLEGGQRRGEFQAEVKPGNSSYDTVMILTIDTVWDRHFRTYAFEATNAVGRSKLDIELRPDHTKLVKSGAKYAGHANIINSSMFLLLTSVLLLVLMQMLHLSV